MKIEISAGTLRDIAKELRASEKKGAEELRQQSAALHENSHQIMFETDLCGTAVLAVVRDKMKEAKAPGYRLLSALIRAVKNPEEVDVGQLQNVPEVMKAFIEKNTENGWLFSTDENARPLAYVITSCNYTPGSMSYRSREEPYVTIELAANFKHSFNTIERFRLSTRDVRNKNLIEIIQSKGFVFETEELLEEYNQAFERYSKYRAMQAEQFWCRGNAYIKKNRYRDSEEDDDEDDGDSYWWWSSKKIDLSPTGTPSRCILDEAGYSEGKTNTEQAEIFCELTKKTALVPTHPLLYCFSLKFHKYTWIHAYQVKPYVYEEDLDQKLVMPKSHQRLVEALTSKVFITRRTEDGDKRSRVLRTKSQSTVILCIGPAGVGKTLTAEAYAEKMKRPLYEVQTAQLGSNAKTIEHNLLKILERSKRLKAPLVINEGDVYIQERGADKDHNAIVAVFLRLFEYHSGLIFVTTNRDDVDGAFISRALALIRYELPKIAERKKLWRILSVEMNCDLSEGLCDELAEEFDEISGRDIQNLIRLTNQYMEAYEIKKPTLKEFQICAPFRGIKPKK
jgi:hypothetical protein